MSDSNDLRRAETRRVDLVDDTPGDAMYWKVRWQVDKYAAGIEDVYAGAYTSSTNAPEFLGQPVKPYEELAGAGNLLVNGGADVLWLGLKGLLTATTGAANTYFNNAEATIGVGDSNSSTGTVKAATNLRATTNKYRKGMDSTYPTHTTGTNSTANRDITFKATFSTAMANFAWNEWGVFNSTASSGGRMLNRKVESLGTKTTAATWAFTVKLSLSTQT